MKMHTLRISTISVLCVLCTVATSAFGAGSVRALGGSGTYNGTAAATTATTSGTTAARAGTATRAGSLRVSPSTTRSISTATRTNADGTTTPTERLSIGKYLGGATSVSTTGGGSAGSSASAGEIQQINQQITQIISDADDLADRVDALELSKQDKLTAGDYIIISEDDEISVDITELEEYLNENLDLPNSVKIRYVAADDALEWSEDGGTTWSRLFSIDDLAGDYVSESELDSKIEALAKYATKEELGDKQPKSTSDYSLGNADGGWTVLSEAQQAALNSGVTSDTVEQVATNTGDIADLADSINGLGGTQSIISSAPSSGVYVLGVVNGEQQLLPVAPDSEGNY